MLEKIENAKDKTEQARLIGVKIPEDDYWGDYTSKTCGSVGGATSGNLTKDSTSSLEQTQVEKLNKKNIK